MNKYISSVAVLSLLLLVGAGCKSQPSEEQLQVSKTNLNAINTYTAVSPEVEKQGEALADGLKGNQPLPPLEDGATSVVDGDAPVSGNVGPAGDSIFVATSSDTKTWALTEDAIQAKASVPDLLRLSHDVGPLRAGELATVFVDASAFTRAGEERIGMMVSSDNGSSWAEMTVLEIAGSEDHIPVDPSLVQLEDGRLRLFYYDFTDSTVQGAPHNFYSAISDDGVNFTLEQEVFSKEGITDPEAVYFNGQWYLFYAMPSVSGSGNIGVALGDADGLNFEDQADAATETAGIPGAWVDNEGTLHLFGCGREGVLRTTTTDGTTYTVADDGIRFEGKDPLFCDPAPVQLEDGSWVLVVKGREGGAAAGTASGPPPLGNE